MKVINKSNDANKVFNEFEKTFKAFKLPRYNGKYKHLGVKIVSGLY